MSEPDFTHDRPGTPASAWDAWLAERDPAAWRLPDHLDRLVVVGAHPDDETLGAGGLVHLAARSGWQVDVVTATAGEASHPTSPTLTPDWLADVRRAELGAAAEVLAPTARVQCLGLPDGAVDRHEDEVAAVLVELVGPHGGRTLLCAPARHDGHPDHEAVGRAGAVAARRTDAVLVEYPVWLWHWGTDRDLSWEHVALLALDDAAAEAKQRAIACHRSQVAPLSDRPGDEVLLGEDLLAHFARPAELLFVGGTDEDDADDDGIDGALHRLHVEQADPWEVGSWYERRKRAATLAALPDERYGSVLEVGCSVGELAADLATRADRVLAVDSSPAAVATATERLAELAGATARVADVPADWPEGVFDLVVVSEVGYFLSPRQLEGTIERALASLAPDGHLVLCHWRHEIVGWPLDGPTVHDRFRSVVGAAGGEVLVQHDEADFELTVLRGPLSDPLGGPR